MVLVPLAVCDPRPTFDRQTFRELALTVAMSELINAQFAPKLKGLWEPRRYKVLWGGRGAGRSWGVARALLLMGTQRQIRVLCAREFQNSIAESVHMLLSQQIAAFNLGGFYEVQRDRILGQNGTSFAFEGIKNNANRIKSYEGIDVCWVEEANKVTKASWNILIPTIRKPASEIWITFNPELEKDYTYQRFVLEPSEDSLVVKMDWRDNPWFPAVLRAEMEDLKLRDFDAYLNVWEGHCVQQLEGAVYAQELRRLTENGQICRVPWDKSVPVDTFWDLGRSDRTCIWFVQRVGMEYRVLDYYESRGEDITHYLAECQSRRYVYGTFWLPHDAKAKTLGTKRSIQETVHAAGWRVRIVPRLSLADGMNAVRLVLPGCYFDEAKTADGLFRLRHYAYKITNGVWSNEPKHDENSDGADAFRYFAVAMKGPEAPSGVGEKLKTRINRFLESAPGAGWMA